MTLPVPRPLPTPFPTVCGDHACAENLLLRQDYIDRLTEFNRAARSNRDVRRAGVEGFAFEQSWRKFQAACASSRDAWSRYKQHVAAHGCKRV